MKSQIGLYWKLRSRAETNAGEWAFTVWTPGRSTFRVVGSFTRKPFDEVNDAEGGWWCLPDGPPASYSWSVSGDTLTLRPVGGTDPCTVRGFVWTGTWRRAG